MTPRLVIFDVDGTLVDSLASIAAIMGLAFAKHGFDEPSPAAVRRIVGRSLDLAIAELLGPPGAEHAALVADSYRDIFVVETGRRPPRLFPGAIEAVQALGRRHDTLLGIATGKSRRGLSRLLEEHESFKGAFHTVQTADDARSKPHPEMVLKAMAECGVHPSATVVVGDSTLDMEMARAAGASAIGVTWGCHGCDELLAAGAHATVDGFDAVVAAIDAALVAAVAPTHA